MSWWRTVAILLLVGASTRALCASTTGVAVLSLRPSADATFGATVLEELPQAQRLRTVLENVVEMVSGNEVVRHDSLRRQLAKSYLVDAFDCRSDPACVAKIALPLVRGGVAAVLVGDYFRADDAYHVRVRLIEIDGARQRAEVTLLVPLARADEVEPWREGLASLFADTGGIDIVTNVTDFSCTIDGAACVFPRPGALDAQKEGEHVLELSRDGYLPASRVAVVKRGERLRLAMALQRAPVQLPAAPDPTARAPVFEAAGREMVTRPFGTLRVLGLIDDHNNGEREDPLVAPAANGTAQLSTVFLTMPAILGVTVQGPAAPDGWQWRAALSGGFIKSTTAELDSAYIEITSAKLGMRVALGLSPHIVSSLTPGTLNLADGFGNLTTALAGARVSQSIGPLLLEATVGKHKSQVHDLAQSGGASPWPLVGGRVAYVNEGLMGTFYRQDFPLTLSASGLYGKERVGVEDAAWVAANPGASEPPALDDLRVYVVSVELFVPIGKAVSISGEAYLGEGTRWFEGSIWQGARFDPTTGHHHGLRSRGGWAQLCVAFAERFEARLIAGLDEVTAGLDTGLATAGGDAAQSDRLIAINLTWFIFDEVGLGIQAQQIATRYLDPSLGAPSSLGALVSAQLQF